MVFDKKMQLIYYFGMYIGFFNNFTTLVTAKQE